ncbi:MAG: DUF374 domain-containing protein [Calditrichaeota bacterium]|nr:DUF374 domain-containing protein [Calditrichota bacterium]
MPLKQRLIIIIGEIVGPFLILTLGRLCRFKVVHSEYLQILNAPKSGAIIALWHGRMLLPVYYFRRRRICALVSRSFDGELITRIVGRLGYITRRGSPKEGGREGFSEMLKDLRAGRTVAIFPDGPTGPRHSVHDGVLHLARLSGAPIVPISYSAHPAWQFNSWDKFLLMKPLSRAALTVGEPFCVPRRFSASESLEYYREIIRRRLCAVEEEADRLIAEYNRGHA